VIAPDAVKQINVRFTYPQVQDGSYFVLAQVDAGNVIVEQDESNNVRASFDSVGLSTPFVDLVPTLSPFTFVRSRVNPHDATITIRNTGNITAAGDITVALTAVSDVTPNPGERPVGTLPLRVNLKPGQRKTFRLRFAFPLEFQRGTYRLVATVDAANAIAERDETNNRVISQTQFDYA
jgi:subtilase family serine protease